MKFNTITTKVGRSFYALIPYEIRILFNVRDGTEGTIEVDNDEVILKFKFPKHEVDTICKKD